MTSETSEEFHCSCTPLVTTILVIYNISLIAFALLPVVDETTEVIAVEAGITVLSVIAIVLILIGILWTNVRTFLVGSFVTGLSGMLTILGFVIGEKDNVNLPVRLLVFLLLIDGVILSFGSYVLRGSRADIAEKWRIRRAHP